jgi:hypothetical protein
MKTILIVVFLFYAFSYSLFSGLLLQFTTHNVDISLGFFGALLVLASIVGIHYAKEISHALK